MVVGRWLRESHLLAEEQLHLPRLLPLVGCLACAHRALLSALLLSRAPQSLWCLPSTSGFWFKCKLLSPCWGCAPHILASLHLFVLGTPAAFPPCSLFESFSFETFYSCFLCICLFWEVVWHTPKTLEVMIWVQVALGLPVPWFPHLLEDGTIGLLRYTPYNSKILYYLTFSLPCPFWGLSFCLFIIAYEEFLSFFFFLQLTLKNFKLTEIERMIQ